LPFDRAAGEAESGKTAECSFCYTNVGQVYHKAAFLRRNAGKMSPGVLMGK